MLDLVTNPSEQKVIMVFMDGLYEEIQQHLFQNQVTTMVEALLLARAFCLARSLTLHDAPIPREISDTTRG